MLLYLISPSKDTPETYYRQVSNISRTLVGNEIVDHSDVVGASPVGAAPTTSSFSTLTHGFNGLGKDNCKTRRKTFKFWNSVRLILETWRYTGYYFQLSKYKRWLCLICDKIRCGKLSDSW